MLSKPSPPNFVVERMRSHLEALQWLEMHRRQPLDYAARSFARIMHPGLSFSLDWLGPTALIRSITVRP